MIERALPTWDALEGTFACRVILDDSGDSEYRAWVSGQYPQWEVVPTGPTRMGYAPAMTKMREVGLESGADYIFHLEDDFMLNAPLDLDDIAGLLDARPYLAQVALRRQAWFANEVEHGGIIEALEVQGQRFHEMTDGRRYWTEHRAVWTANPNLFRRDIAERPYPLVNFSEAAFMRELRADPQMRCAFWGKRSDPLHVEHIGAYRNGVDY